MNAHRRTLAAPTLSQKARDLQALRDAVGDAANTSATLWLSYLFVLFYLLIAAGSVTHADLLLENPVKLPFLNIELPLNGFAWLGPAMFIIVHAYVLLNLVLLAGKVEVFNEQLQAQVTDPESRARLRRQLPNNVFVQFLSGPSDVRAGLVGWMLMAIAWISLIIGPVALLVFFELQLLPYHNEKIALWQRLAVLGDIALLWLLWPAVSRGEPVSVAWRNMGKIRACVIGLVSALPILLVFVIATFPGEKIDGTLRVAPIDWLRAKLVAGKMNFVSRRLDSVWANVLVLPGFDAVDHAKFKTDDDIFAARKTISLRGRDLVGAILIGAALPNADFTGADLDEAQLALADLRSANFGCGSPLEMPFETSATTCTSLRGAFLYRAQLQGATLSGAQLQGASAFQVNLQGADLGAAKLQSAMLGSAQLQGAMVNNADLEAAVLDEADLRGAFVVSDLRGASLVAAQLQGAYIYGATYEATDLSAAFLWRADAYLWRWKSRGQAYNSPAIPYRA